MKKEIVLPDDASLSDTQKYVQAVCKQRGFDKETLQDAFVLLAEEIGELAHVVRKSSGIKVDVQAQKGNAAEELADILIYVLHIANILNIDIEQAFRNKEEINKKRTWV